MEKVSKEIGQYNTQTFFSGMARAAMILISIAVVIAGLLGVLFFVAKIL